MRQRLANASINNEVHKTTTEISNKTDQNQSKQPTSVVQEVSKAPIQ